MTLPGRTSTADSEIGEKFWVIERVEWGGGENGGLERGKLGKIGLERGKLGKVGLECGKLGRNGENEVITGKLGKKWVIMWEIGLERRKLGKMGLECGKLERNGVRTWKMG